MSPDTPAWSAFGRSAKAAAKPVNQDRLGWQALGEGRTGLALAVADGHGSSAHPRSDTGADLAVSAFLETARGLWASIQPGEHLRHIKIRAEEDMPRNVLRSWQQRVGQHMAANPADPELDTAPAVLYGTTLIGAVITQELVIGWQLGDGDMCFVEADGQAAAPLRRRTEDLGDETDSLCSRNAHLLMRTYWRLSTGSEGPALVTLSTDGLSNSFISFDSYLEFISGLHSRLKAEGAERVTTDLPGWLEAASSFSGDDATLLVAYREHPADHGSGASP